MMCLRGDWTLLMGSSPSPVILSRLLTPRGDTPLRATERERDVLVSNQSMTYPSFVTVTHQLVYLHSPFYHPHT